MAPKSRGAIAIGAWASLLVVPARAEDILSSLKAGLTVAQVHALAPAAVAGSHERLSSRASEELRVPSIWIAGSRFEGLFYFRDNSLVEVRLRALDAARDNETLSLTRYDDVVRKLMTAFGHPKGCQVAKNISLFEGCEWMTAKVTVDILYLSLGGEPVLFEIVWRGR